MERKDEDVKVKVSSRQKEVWLNFIKKSKNLDNLSQLVRYCVQGYIDNDLIEKEFSSQKEGKKESEIDGVIEVLKQMKDFKKAQESQNEKLHMISSYVLNGQRTFPSESIQSMEKNDIESEIINLLEINPLNSEQLAKVFKLPEHRILRFLNPMLKNHILGFNDKMEYVIVESEAQLKELKFNEVE